MMNYVPLERLRVPRPVERIGYLRRAVAAKTVLDIGALDETAYQLKQAGGSWLHLELAKMAKKVVGIDNSALIPCEGLETSPNSKILRLDVSRIQELPNLEVFDVIVAGEVIEHLPNVQEFLSSLRSAGFQPGTELLLSTPNATALHNVGLGLLNRESAHKDHVAVYSYKTLNTLCLRAGLSSWRIVPYFVRFTEMLNSSQGMARIGVASAEQFVNGASWLFPMLAAGWIVHASI